LASRFFPPAEHADESDLVLVGGKLNTEWLLDAYRHGIFPWPMWGDEMPMTWFSLDPRAIIELNDIYISKRLRRTLRSGKFEVTCDRAFKQVMEGCALPRKDEGETWITPTMKRGYCQLHEQGHAHSVEVWHEGQLAGGIYGVTIGGLFAGESMFHNVTDASKVALVSLVHHLKSRGYQLFDIQQWTPHTGSMGAIEISRTVYLHRLKSAVDFPVSFGKALETIEL